MTKTKGFVLWLTGLSGAGKTTLAASLARELTGRGVKLEILDGDEVRTNLSKGLGFSKEDRDTNIRRIGYVCRLLSRNGVPTISAAISPTSPRTTSTGTPCDMAIACSAPRRSGRWESRRRR